jgi:tRNA nucleotidyltransferase (CCA-adding enzyme)
MKTYMVGGAVRDTLCGVTPKDTDYVVVGSTSEEMLAKGYKQVGADFPVFLHPKTQDQYALARTERKSGTGHGGFTTETLNVTLEEDLSRRDFTINSMALDAQFNLYDPFGGEKDLESKILRHVSPSFAEDPLRILRAARFLARFGPRWTVARETMILMQGMVERGTMDELAEERIWVEIEKGLGERYPERMLELLWELRILSRPSFAEYAGGLVACTKALQQAVTDNSSIPVRFALAFPRKWQASELKNSRIPKHVREVSHCLQVGIDTGLGIFNILTPAEKVEALTAIDAFRQHDRTLYILAALRYLYPEQTPAIADALAAIALLNNEQVIAGVTDGREIRARIKKARNDAVSAVKGPSYIPVAVYKFGCCHYGATTPFKTVEVKADSMDAARTAAFELLKPSTVQHLRHIETRPNPLHMMTLVAAGHLQPPVN